MWPFRRNNIPNIAIADFAATLAAEPDTLVVDVREPHEYAAGHVPGALSMPLTTIPGRHHELPRDQTVHLICQAGGRSARAAAWLSGQGFRVANVTGGTGAWIGRGHRVVTGTRPR
jgi:rhodanese-related sulfurtransferase